MANTSRNPRQGEPNDASAMEQAEGSRENLNDSPGRVQEQMGDRDNAGGITNRPLDEEVHEQDELPPRGQRKDEAADAE